MAWAGIEHDKFRKHIRGLTREQRLLFMVKYAHAHAAYVKENYEIVIDGRGNKCRQRKKGKGGE